MKTNRNDYEDYIRKYARFANMQYVQGEKIDLQFADTFRDFRDLKSALRIPNETTNKKGETVTAGLKYGKTFLSKLTNKEVQAYAENLKKIINSFNKTSNWTDWRQKAANLKKNNITTEQYNKMLISSYTVRDIFYNMSNMTTNISAVHSGKKLDKKNRMGFIEILNKYDMKNFSEDEQSALNEIMKANGITKREMIMQKNSNLMLKNINGEVYIIDKNTGEIIE